MKLISGQHQQKRSHKLIIISLTCLTAGTLIAVLNPLQLILDYMLTMYPGSYLWNIWKNPPLNVYISVYLFNITNLDRFLKGIDSKIKLDEVGPYVYQEFLENQDAVYNDNDTVSFRPVRRVEFVREKSIGDPKVDVVTVPNVPYMGVTTAASKVSLFAALAIRALMTTMESNIVFNLTVHDYLWGYDDPLVKLASKLLPGVIHFETFGLLDRMFDEGKNLVTMNLPSKKRQSHRNNGQNQPHAEKQVLTDEEQNQLGEVLEEIVYQETTIPKNKNFWEPNVRDYSIDNWNGRTGLPYWGYEEGGGSANSDCNVLRGTYDGTLFPRNITKGETFRIYRKTFCRTLPIEYSHPGDVNGIDAYFFKLADNAFDSDLNDPASSCFCTNNVCLKKGLGNITPCYYNIPAAISFPHFYNGDPSLLKSIEGLQPDEEKHGSIIVLQPQLGIPMKVYSRFQINLLMGEVKFNSAMRKFKDTVLPIFWLEISIDELPYHLVLLLKLLFNVAPYLQSALIWIFAIVGTSTLGLAGLLYFCFQRAPEDFMPKKNVKYSAIYLFPYIKREIITRYKEEEESCLPNTL